MSSARTTDPQRGGHREEPRRANRGRQNATCAAVSRKPEEITLLILLMPYGPNLRCLACEQAGTRASEQASKRG